MPDFTLSPKVKEAIKFALAFIIVYYVALKVAWMNPYWAGLAVGMLALVPGGQSVHKGVMRMAGTIPAVIVALIIFTIAPQERWLFISLASLWFFFITYMLVKSDAHRYFWQVAGFVCLVILETSTPGGEDVFEHVVARLLETLLGVSVFTLVSVFLWPDKSVKQIEQAAIASLGTQIKLFSINYQDLSSDEMQENALELHATEIQNLDTLKLSYKTISSENYQTYENLPLWTKFHDDSTTLMKALLHMHNSFAGLVNINIGQVSPNIAEYKTQIKKRLGLSIKYFEEKNFDYEEKKVELKIVKEYYDELNSFQKVSFDSSLKILKRIDVLSQSILETSKKFMDESLSLEIEVTPKKEKRSYIDFLLPDIDNLKLAFFSGMSVFIGFSIWIFFNPPGHVGWLMLTSTVFLTVAITPQMKVKKILPLFLKLLIASLIIYAYVLPHFTSYLGLASVLFISMFSVVYFFPPPLRVFGIIPIIMVIKIENQQVYDFAAQANSALYIIMVFTYVALYSYLVGSTRPEKVLFSLMRRYFKSAQYLLSTQSNAKQKNFIQKIQDSFYTYEMNTLPTKLSAWAKAIDTKSFPLNSSQQITKLVTKIEILSYTLIDLRDMQEKTQGLLLSREIQEELYLWEESMKNVFIDYQADIGLFFSENLKKEIHTHSLSIEKYITKDTQASLYSNFTKQESEHAFKYLASFQGLSFALVSYAQVSEKTDWNHWKEEVFS